MKENIKTFWLSYDLGLKGDYEGLYQWLDNHQAKECGSALAVFKRNVSSDDFAEDIKSELAANVKFKDSDRIYLVWRDDKLNKGQFIIGGRKRAPWEGYASTFENAQVDSGA